ncbi:hypothetical protein LTR27_000353 [Elasticomyces elasticus]|nr:hypothetical protein LTR27_000353 [Elasticomyces elasticus]
MTVFLTSSTLHTLHKRLTSYSSAPHILHVDSRIFYDNIASYIHSDSTPPNQQPRIICQYARLIDNQEESGTLRKAWARLRTTLQRPSQRRTGCPLLDLPPQLRNQIWSYVLHEQHSVPVSSATSQQPALLRTSRQIRNETRGIFLHENTFRIIVTDLKMTVPRQHWLETGVTDSNARIFRLVGTMNRYNLKQWLKQFHERRGVGFRLEGLDMPSRRAVRAAVRIVEIMMDARWDVVEPVLQIYFVRVLTGHLGHVVWT